MLIEKAFIELTQEQMITIITACQIRLSTMNDLYERAKQKNLTPDIVFAKKEYWLAKEALDVLNQAEWRLYSI